MKHLSQMIMAVLLALTVILGSITPVFAETETTGQPELVFTVNSEVVTEATVEKGCDFVYRLQYPDNFSLMGVPFAISDYQPDYMKYYIEVLGAKSDKTFSHRGYGDIHDEYGFLAIGTDETASTLEIVVRRLDTKQEVNRLTLHVIDPIIYTIEAPVYLNVDGITGNLKPGTSMKVNVYTIHKQVMEDLKWYPHDVDTQGYTETAMVKEDSFDITVDQNGKIGGTQTFHLPGYALYGTMWTSKQKDSMAPYGSIAFGIEDYNDADWDIEADRIILRPWTMRDAYGRHLAETGSVFDWVNVNLELTNTKTGESVTTNAQKEVVFTLHYTGKPLQTTGLKASPAGKNKVNLSWNAVEGSEGYLVYGQKNGKYGYVGMTANTSFTDSKALDTDYNYYWVFPYTKDAAGNICAGSCEKYAFAKGVCKAVTNLKAASVKGGVKLSWSPSAGADGYLVYGIVGGKAYSYVGMTTKGTTFIDKKASTGQYNYYWVYPYHTDASGKMIVGQTAKYTYGKALK